MWWPKPGLLIGGGYLAPGPSARGLPDGYFWRRKKREHIINTDTQQEKGTNGVARYTSYCAQGGEADRSAQWLTVG